MHDIKQPVMPILKYYGCRIHKIFLGTPFHGA